MRPGSEARPHPVFKSDPYPTMVDLPPTSVETSSNRDGPRDAAGVGVGPGAFAGRLSGDGADGTIQVVEEHLKVSVSRRSTGIVRVGTRTEVIEEPAEAELDRYRVEVTRVPVGRLVHEAPSARAVGDTTIIPVVEERLVVVKQLFLVEEIHVRHVLEREVVREPVTLRRQRAIIERVGGRDDPPSPWSSIDPGHDGP